MKALMKRLAVVSLLAACGTDMAAPDAASDWSTTRTFAFGPFTIQPTQEISDQCVQITLGNADYVYINSVELTTGPGFHHSNWFFVPERVFPGPSWNGSNSAVDDGTFACNDRHFDQPIAAIFGGVLFAQSTQSPHEVQQFPAGVVIKIPPHAKIVSTIHLLNPTDSPLSL